MSLHLARRIFIAVAAAVAFEPRRRQSALHSFQFDAAVLRRDINRSS